MGLASALSTALTGLDAAETNINVIGNNLANSNTVGFKASSAVFATQFLQTNSLGSLPSGDSGGTNPSQIGLGTEVAEITPDFSQGTLQVSGSPSDLAIQGNGFFLVQGNGGETLYTRDGQFQTNSDNQLVTATGNELLGYGVNDDFALNTTQLQPLTIPLGTSAVAQATQNVDFEGDLPPSDGVASSAQIIQSGILGNNQYAAPPAGTTETQAVGPDTSGITSTITANGTGPLGPGTYDYEIVYTDAEGNETDASPFSVTVPAGDNNVNINLNNLPTDSSGQYVGRNIYRTENLSTAGPNPTYYLDQNLSTDNTTTSVTDSVSDATLTTGTPLNTSSLSGNYSYYVTYVKPGVPESEPSPLVGPLNVTDGRITISDLPTPTGQYAGGQVRIYRNTVADPSTFYAVATVNPGGSYVDDVPDSTITNTASPNYEQLDFNGPAITPNTPLINVQQFNGTSYQNLFQTGVLSFTGSKGGSTLSPKTLTITSTTTVQDLVNFMTGATGIQPASSDPANPIPGDPSGTPQGGTVLGDGQIQIVSNNGTDNAVSVPLSAFTLTPSGGGAPATPNLGFTTTQNAAGQSASTDFVAYDSLGNPVNVTVTVDLESTTSDTTTYRWFADSPSNDPPGGGTNIAVGTGLVTFNSNGDVVSGSNNTVSIEQGGVASGALQFNLDFNQLSGLATTAPTLSVTNQDGSAPGTLSSYIINTDGTIQGVYSNGVTRTLGQIPLANFTNPAGLAQEGQNTFAGGVNSGLPVIGTAGTQGIGTIVAGSLEESNTDIGQNLIDLILASTAYRGNTQVVTTTNQLYDDLFSLNR